MGQTFAAPATNTNRICLLVTLLINLHDRPPIRTQALIDSGAQKSFVDAAFIKKLSIPTTPLEHPVRLHMADGNPSLHGPVTDRATLHLTIADHHHEELPLHVTKLQTHAIILGIDWLQTHNPAINWKRHVVSFQDDFCNKNCLDQYSPVLSLETLVSDLDLDLDLAAVAVAGKWQAGLIAPG